MTMTPTPPWRHCEDCEVWWRTDEPACWTCGAEVAPTPGWRGHPTFNSQTGHGGTPSADWWERVRERVLSEGAALGLTAERRVS